MQKGGERRASPPQERLPSDETRTTRVGQAGLIERRWIAGGWMFWGATPLLGQCERLLGQGAQVVLAGVVEMEDVEARDADGTLKPGRAWRALLIIALDDARRDGGRGGHKEPGSSWGHTDERCVLAIRPATWDGWLRRVFEAPRSRLLVREWKWKFTLRADQFWRGARMTLAWSKRGLTARKVGSSSTD